MKTADRGPSGPLSILLSCPKCGGPFTADDETASVTCEHCGSLLLLAAPERDEIYRADGQVADAQGVLEIVILYRVQSQRAEIVSRYQDKDGNPPSEAFIEARLRAYEQRVRSVTRIVEARRFQVPYWHISGAILQGILGRQHDGPKIVRLRAFAVEHTVPGYDVAKANLRDKGLRLARAKVQPLRAKEVQAHGPFLPWVPVPDRPYREIDKWRGLDMDPGVEPVTKLARFLFARRALVYRSYWLARVLSDTDQEWVLIDGSFETIAGHPDELETRALLALAGTDPLHSGEESFRRVQVAASRCPDCGFEESFDRRDRIVVCSSCHLALEPQPSGVRLVPYCHIPPASLDADYLPFWRYEFRVQIAGGAAVSRLEDYVRALFPQGAPPGFAVAGPYLWIPAFRLLGSEPGDETFGALVEWIHGARVEAEPGKIPLGGKPGLWGVSVQEADARTLAPFVLMRLHGKPSAARLNTLLVRKAIEQASIELTGATLVMVPFERNGEEVRAAGRAVHVPMLLLRGGPELDAQRVTVHGALHDASGV